MKILYWTGYFIAKIAGRVIFRGRIIGKEHVPRSGGFILASNHRSYFDPPLAGSATGREMAFFAKAELFAVPVLGSLIRRTNAMPVKRGSVDRDALKTAVATIRKGYGLTVFPEGTRSRDDSFLEPKPGLGLIALHAECPIVPCYLHGTNKLKQCLLGREKLRVAFGEPLPVEWVRSFPKSKEGYVQLAREVMDRIAKIKAASGL
ncbi:MAG TPA: lysophospholipid acyltransferase family protein [candidate division Zixibacteria bacterium]|nr:1-acyl-sn-glycerol-3-phosphate acyltransferase [candidate division Zixibacteria bacterium]MDD4916282.1 lysophospholipid acyltransferase family protein [candidate division Zixibacteria bacterium]MDM7973663.1 lysophospholipid acyltransferase family protein [candidate division Zixibacteria bacterium]HOD67190.1 lysophospholipid acyltransferase family protein [candidate division Zixibacteria bacterium]HPC11279.1 lysophospholipid acyltransferase family protein [candidate division Zixibacteria bact